MIKNLNTGYSIIVISLILSFSTIYSQDIQWSYTYESNYRSHGLDVSIDSSNNVYFRGVMMYRNEIGNDIIYEDTNIISKFSSSGEEISTLTYHRKDEDQVCYFVVDNLSNLYLLIPNNNIDSNRIRKYNKDNILLWEKYIGIHPYAITIDNNGNIFAASHYLSANEQKARITKFDSDANKLWDTQFGYGEWNNISLRSIKVDQNGFIYLVGYVGWTVADIFFAKFNEDGSLIWDKRINGQTDAQDEGFEIAIDNNNNVIVFGFVDKPWIEYNYTYWLGKFNSQGNEEWTRTDINSGFAGCKGLTIGKNNDIFISGKYESKPFIRRYDTSGNKTWEIHHDFYGIINSIALDKSQNLYFAGDSSDSFWLGKICLNPISVISNPISPLKFENFQNFPNPFSQFTTLKYSLYEFGHVQLIIYNVFGREITTIVDDYQTPDDYMVNFNTSDLPSGLYYGRLVVNGYSKLNKMLLIK